PQHGAQSRHLACAVMPPGRRGVVPRPSPCVILVPSRVTAQTREEACSMGISRRVGAAVGAGHRSLAVLAGVVLASSLAGGAVSAQDPVTFRVGITEKPSQTALNPYLAVIAEDYL